MTDSSSSWVSIYLDKVAETATNLVSILPELLAGVAVLIVGWLLARVIRSATKHLSNGINRVLERFFRRGESANMRVTGPAIAVVAEAAFWLTLFLSVILATHVAGFTPVSTWLVQVVAQLPNFVVGVAIIFFGYLASLYVGRLASKGRDEKSAGEFLFIGRILQGIIFVSALIVGLDQLGVQVSFLTTILTVAVGAVLAGFSIAFGLGAREHVRNLIGGRVAQNALTPGLRVKIGETEGEILEIASSHLALETATGRTLIPASRLDVEIIEILTATGEHEDG